ncbi:uncharacterized protein METZ01_LOCUS506511, partial [marine metagenome]
MLLENHVYEERTELMGLFIHRNIALSHVRNRNNGLT